MSHIGGYTGGVHQGAVVLVLLIHVLSQLGYQSLFMLSISLQLARDFGEGIEA